MSLALLHCTASPQPLSLGCRAVFKHPWPREAVFTRVKRANDAKNSNEHKPKITSTSSDSVLHDVINYCVYILDILVFLNNVFSFVDF